MSPWEFACNWYTVDEIHRCLNETGPFRTDVPADVRSREFAEWLTRQYRLAMTKGMMMAAEVQAYEPPPRVSAELTDVVSEAMKGVNT